MIEKKILPEEFVKRLHSEPQLDAAALIDALTTTEPAVGVRINPAKPGPLPEWMTDAREVKWSRNGYLLPQRPIFTLEPSLHAGGFYVQDPSSMILETIMAHLTSDGSPVRVLDMCAAPGGKTTAAIASLPAGSLMVANEIMPQRVQILAENIIKWGHHSSIVTSTDAQTLGNTLGQTFDIVILDAPCSGEGMMRKDEKAVEQWSPGLVESCARLQREIAEGVLPALKAGGILVYSTCTFSRTENESMVEWLMDTYGMESVDLRLDSLGVPSGWSSRACTYRFMPHLTTGEGLFVAVLRLPEAIGKPNKKGKKKEKKGSKAFPIKELPVWVENPQAYEPLLIGDNIHLIPAAHTDVIQSLQRADVKMLAAGVKMGEVMRKDIIPSHELALSTALRRDAFPNVELSRDQALNYLRRENIQLPEGMPRGYVTVSREGRILGFMKNIGNRANNLYPQLWRIRNK